MDSKEILLKVTRKSSLNFDEREAVVVSQGYLVSNFILMILAPFIWVYKFFVLHSANSEFCMFLFVNGLIVLFYCYKKEVYILKNKKLHMLGIICSAIVVLMSVIDFLFIH